MRKIILLTLLTNISLAAYNQVITGTIFDNETKKPVYSAAVYFNGISAGTLSDQNGNFKLDILKFGSMPLSVSAIGYYSVTLASFSTNKPNMVYMKPKLIELDEVIVNDKSHARERKQNLRTFRDIFLGTTVNAAGCEIKNEDDIRFIASPDKDTLTAYALKPVLIDNKSLGYIITYYLEEFRFNRPDSTFMINGEIIFKDKKDTLVGIKDKINYDKRRRSTYLGSRMHFFRSLWFNELDSAGFKIYDSKNDSLTCNNIVSQNSSHSKYLKYRGSVSIIYDNIFPASLMIFLKDSIFFDPNGYFEPHAISWEGEMAKQRIADILPYNYSPGE